MFVSEMVRNSLAIGTPVSRWPVPEFPIHIQPEKEAINMSRSVKPMSRVAASLIIRGTQIRTKRTADGRTPSTVRRRSFSSVPMINAP